jgi:large subunit ribosomal protein L25
MAVELNVQKREILGRAVKSLRKKGLIPAELYGHGFNNLHLSVPLRDFSSAFKQAGESSLLKLKIEGEKDKEINVLIHDISRHPLTDEILQVDFYQVRMDEKIRTSVPLHFIGEAPAIKEKDGILVKAMQEIEIEALPVNLPQSIEVDLSPLVDIGASIYVKDIKSDKNVKLLVEPDTVVATVTEKAKEEEVPPAITVEEVKIEGEEKKEAKEEEEEAGEKQKVTEEK